MVWFQYTSVASGSSGPLVQSDVRQRFVIGGERFVGFKRDSRRDDARLGQRRSVFVELDGVGDPQRRGIRQQGRAVFARSR